MEQKADESRWRRRGKELAVFLLIIAGLLLLIQILFNFFAEPYLKKQVQSAASKKAFHAEIDDLELSVLRRQLKVTDLRISRDSEYSDSSKASTVPLDSVIVESITFNGFQFVSYFLGSRLALDHVQIDKPRIYLVQPSSSKNSGGQKTNVNASILEQLESNTKFLRVDEFAINGLTGTVRKPASSDPFATVHNIHLTLSDIRIDSGWAKEYALLPTSDFHGSLDSLRCTSSSKLYDFKISALRFSSTDSSLSTETIAVMPRLSKYKFSQSVGHQIDRIDLDVSGTEWRNINLPALVEDKALNASVFQIKESRLEVFHSKIPSAPEPERKKFPHVQLQEMKYPVEIDSILINNADIFYIERLDEAPKPGYVSFENTNAIIRNVYNTYEKAADENPITVETSSQIMGTGRVDVSFRFPVTGTNAHSLTGKIGAMPIRSLNPVLKYLGQAEASGGQIHSIDFQIDFKPKESQGAMNAHYTGLELKMIDFDGSEKESRNLASFLANNLVVNENNEPPLREGKISLDRNPNKSIFNYWWKSLLSGLKSSIGF